MNYQKTRLNTIKRGAKKASYNKEVVYGILDSTEVCHVAFMVQGRPMVQPINYGRKDEFLYLHGSYQNRMTSALIQSGEVTLNVLLLDSMKLTRSAFNHSVNYRSVVVFGSVKELTTNEEKLDGLKHIINHFVPGRWDDCRKPNDKELKATRVVEIKIETASAKVANTPGAEKKKDYKLSHWAGVIPIKQICDYPIPDDRMDTGTEIPKYLLEFYEKRKDGI